MASRRKPRQYEEGAEAARQFNGAVRQILSVSREELAKREAEYQESIKDKPRRGPKPRQR
jgi:hypothetical protein